MQIQINVLQPEMLQQVAVNMSFLSGKLKLWKQRLKRFFQPLESLIEGSLSSFLSEKGILPFFWLQQFAASLATYCCNLLLMLDVAMESHIIWAFAS